MNIPFKRCDHNKNKVEGCPICLKREVVFNMKKTLISDSFQGSSPAPFVGRFNYPNINVGILSPQHMGEENWRYDAPKVWAREKYTIPDVVNLRSELINSRFTSNIKDVRKDSKYIDMARQIGMASKPVDVEITLNSKPAFRTNFDNYMAPTGPNALLKNANLTSNPKIDRKVDKVFDDIDLKATDAIKYLYRNAFDETNISKILSVGAFGLKKDRKLVPTRWSITAVDDMLGKSLLEEVKKNPEMGYFAYFGNHIGNYYLIMFFPEPWSYELFETYVEKKNPWSKEGLSYATDYESYEGRKDYAHETAGGYYTPRLAVLEHLKSIKRSASVLVLRFITDEYTTPLGVWVTREASRNAMNNKPIEFGSIDLMLRYAKIIAKNKFGTDIEELLNKSKLLSNIKNQKKLSNFYN
jgi:hypothetical protein